MENTKERTSLHQKFTGSTNNRFAKESLFNILNNRIDFEDCKLLELFAGTGNIGYEFASEDAIKSLYRCEFSMYTIHQTNEQELQFNNRVIRSEVIRF